jgi:nucleotide-binding universal stress UspA family protein
MVGTELASDVILDKAVRDGEIKYLEEITERLKAISTVPIFGSISDGTVAESIQDHAKLVKADLIVMSTHGRGSFVRFWLGSVADAVARHSTVPTLLIRPNEQQGAELTNRPFVKSIIVPLDGSELAERIIGPATRLGRAVGAEYCLVLVLDAVEDIENLAKMKIDAPGAWFPEATEAKALSYLDKVADQMASHSLKVHRKIIRHGSAAEAILHYAQAHANPLIAVATHGRSGIRRVLFGSVADKIVRGSTMPVLVYHPFDLT